MAVTAPLIYLIMLGSTIWVACDAKALQVTTDGKPYHRWNGVVAWVFCCIILWIVAFPYYLSRRSSALRNPTSTTPALTEEDKKRTPLVLCGALLVAFLIIALSCWVLAQQY